MNILESLLAEFQERPIPRFTPRSTRLPEVPGHANAVIGMRRAGKTYRLFQEMQRLLDAGVPKSHLLHINFEDDRLGTPDPGLPGLLLEAFYRRDPTARQHHAYIFFDEIQNVDGWERFVRRVLDVEDCRVYISGSSAKLLSTEVATALRGRSLATELVPFSFAEFLAHAGIPRPAGWPGPRVRSTLEAVTRDYLRVGGFPAVQNLVEFDRIALLQDYAELVVFRDVVERHSLSNITALRYLVGHLLNSCARPFSINRLCRELTSQGLAVGKDTLHTYLAYLTDAFLLFTIAIHRKSYRARMVNPRKVYCVDPGLARAMSHTTSQDVGALLENAVYLELRRRSGQPREGDIAYFLTASGREVDFVVQPRSGEPLQLVQVCADVSRKETRQREIEALVEAIDETGAKSAVIVTLHEDETVERVHGAIPMVPFWRWALDIAPPAGPGARRAQRGNQRDRRQHREDAAIRDILARQRRGRRPGRLRRDEQPVADEDARER